MIPNASPTHPFSGIPKDFAERVVRWQKRQGRHDLPWQCNRDPYAIWVSEIMLQQTQVATVRPYYERFMKRFPTLDRLGRARQKTVLLHFAGLGYYARARNLHAAARLLTRQGRGIPEDFHGLIALPGIGRSTAGAILTLAFETPYPILDGNVRRLFARFFDGRNPERSREETTRLWVLAERLVPRIQAAAYTQGLMDLGAMVCTRQKPDCPACPLARDCCFAKTPPARPASRRVPVRERSMRLLMVEHRRQLYLIERPARGIWGGLHCLPEIGREEDPEAWLEKQFHARPEMLARLPSIQHQLTHMRLVIEPYHAVLAHKRTRPGNLPGHWVSRACLSREPLPAPIARLLQWPLVHSG
ncbi:MAG: A/G-specific adenine glycosylase [Gammaproteobacteria bacterium]